MNKFGVAIMIVFLVAPAALSQTQDLPKFEVAAEFTTLERESFNGRRTEPGIGGRFTFNLNENFALEAAGYFFPKRCFTCRNNGRVTEVLGGVKVGKRFEKWGIFAKARPGVVSFSEGEFNIVLAPPTAGAPPGFQGEVNRINSFAFDLGGVVEFYPSRRIVTRFDAGDTILHFGPRNLNFLSFDPITASPPFLVPFTRPSRTTHNFQFMASVGFRF